MNATTTERLRAGREAAQRRRHAREDDQLREYRAWLELESSTHRTYAAQLRALGAHDPETHAARCEWSAALSLIPQLPPDSAFVRERGE